jgi:hypothetical protein
VDAALDCGRSGPPTAALAPYGYRGGQELRPADLRALIPLGHLRFIEGCRDYFETVRQVFVHAD